MPEPTTFDPERELIALADRIGYPATPTLAPEVIARLSADRRHGVRLPLPGVALWSRRRLLAAVAIGVLAVLGIAAAARLVIGAFEIRVQPGVTPAPSVSTVDPGDLGRPASVAAAEAEAGFRVALPPGPPPDEVYVAEGLGGTHGIVLAWRPGTGGQAIGGSSWSLLLMAFPNDVDAALKTVGRFEAIRETAVDGRPAFWVGVPHLIWFETDDGSLGPYSVLGNVLIWETVEGITYRMETPLPRAEAIALAERLA